MSKRHAYSIELLLKMKQINPDCVFEGEDKRVWDEFVEKQAEESLLECLNDNEIGRGSSKSFSNVAKEENKVTKKNKTIRKVKQVVEPTDTESLSATVKNDEIDESTSEE